MRSFERLLNHGEPLLGYLEVKKMEETEWLPVVEFDGVEYVVDVAGGRFRSRIDPDDGFGFYSDRGREMVAAMVGTVWRVWMPREVVTSEQVV